jgi:hypothetical protein
MNISLENWLRHRIDVVEQMNDYSVPTDVIRAWIDLYNELKALHNKNEYLFHLGFANKVKDGFCDEVADAIIRLLDIVGYYKIDIEKQIELKMMYNAGRAYLHNKEY